MQRVWLNISLLSAAFCIFNNGVFAKANSPEALNEKSYFRTQRLFAHRLVGQAMQESKPNENIFLSPLSANIALSMLLEGAQGSTKEIMLTSLGLSPNFSVSHLHKLQQSYIRTLQQITDGSKISINNALWVDSAFPLKSQFSENLAKYYNAQVANLDFKNNAQKAANLINQWAYTSTMGKIPEITSADIVQQLEMLLANATYFKGMWQYEFAKEKTYDWDFQTEQGVSKIPMMRRKIHTKYLQKAFQAIRLPYKGDTLAMYVILPPQNLNSSAREWATQKVLDLEFWDNLDSQMIEKEVELSFPKFRLKDSKILNKTLSALGFSDLFTTPNLSGLSSANTRVGFVKQDTFIQVDEEGTEAAAVTSIGIERTSVGPLTLRMTVDRPFFFAIRDDKTKNFLFMGYIANPSW